MCLCVIWFECQSLDKLTEFSLDSSLSVKLDGPARRDFMWGVVLFNLFFKSPVLYILVMNFCFFVNILFYMMVVSIIGSERPMRMELLCMGVDIVVDQNKFKESITSIMRFANFS